MEDEFDDFELDEIGDWSERKIRIVAKYAKPFAQIIKSKRLHAFYIDGFSGGGVHVKKDTGERVLGTARQILQIDPKFERYYFVDADEKKAAAMRRACAGRSDAEVICGDANEVLPKQIFPQIRYADFRRAFCFLDPYKMLLDWSVVCAAAQTKTIEAFIHFPTLDVQRNALLKDRAKVRESDWKRMTNMWGDDSWQEAAYSQQPGLFESIETKQPIDKVIEAFRGRLKNVAGFNFVSAAMPMFNKTNGIVYHLVFVTQNETAINIATDIMEQEKKPPTNGR